MTKEENVQYLTLRGEECHLPENEILLVTKRLKELEEKDFDHLKRISEPAFRKWCKEACLSKKGFTI